MVIQRCALEDLEFSGTAFMNGPIVYRQDMCGVEKKTLMHNRSLKR